jgi:toxin CptA
MMLGAGGVIVPGSNDSLLLLGVPLFHPHALAALLVMGLSIWAGLLAMRRFVRT